VELTAEKSIPIPYNLRTVPPGKELPECMELKSCTSILQDPGENPSSETALI
jgi:hypothetical protein